MTDADVFSQIEAYISRVRPSQRPVIEYMHAFISKSVPTLNPHYAHNMLAYGSFPYVTYKKERVQWPVIALAGQKRYVSIYVCSISDGKYLPEKYKDDLGKVSVGKHCIRFTSVEKVNLETLQKLLREAEKTPGFGDEHRHGRKE